jgi:hypothetical protein
MHYSKTGEVDIQSGYMWQMQMQMLFTGRNTWYFAAFNHNFPQMPILIAEINADKAKQQKLREGLVEAVRRYNAAEETYIKLTA